MLLEVWLDIPKEVSKEDEEKINSLSV